MVNYAQGKVYKLTDNTNGNVYISSTAERTLARRLSTHESCCENGCWYVHSLPWIWPSGRPLGLLVSTSNTSTSGLPICCSKMSRIKLIAGGVITYASAVLLSYNYMADRNSCKTPGHHQGCNVQLDDAARQATYAKNAPKYDDGKRIMHSLR